MFGVKNTETGWWPVGGDCSCFVTPYMCVFHSFVGELRDTTFFFFVVYLAGRPIY